MSFQNYNQIVEVNINLNTTGIPRRNFGDIVYLVDTELNAGGDNHIIVNSLAEALRATNGAHEEQLAAIFGQTGGVNKITILNISDFDTPTDMFEHMDSNNIGYYTIVSQVVDDDFNGTFAPPPAPESIPADD